MIMFALGFLLGGIIGIFAGAAVMHDGSGGVDDNDWTGNQ